MILRNIFNKFYNLIDNINNKIENYHSENQKLTELRDWLLPMLMNGQVKVGDVVEDGAVGIEAYKVRGK